MTQLDTRAEKPDNRKTWLWAAATALVVIVGLIAVLTSGNEEPPVATDPPPTTQASEASDPSALLGWWSGGNVSVMFEEDTYAFVATDVLVDNGTYTTRQDRIEFVSADDTNGCDPGDPGTHQFETTGDTVSMVALDDNCYARAFVLPLPSEGSLVEMTPTDPVDLESMATDFDIEGYWGSESMGAVFDAGRYTLVNGDVVDTGTYAYSASPYRVTLTSEQGEGECVTVFGLVDGERLSMAGGVRGVVCNDVAGPLFDFNDLAPSEPFEIPDTGTSGGG